MSGCAATVDQDQLVTRAQSTQVEEAGVGRETVLGKLVLDRTGELRKRVQRVVDGAETLLLEILGGDDGHRRRALDLRALDARTGYRDAIQFGGFLAGLGRFRGGLLLFLVGCVLCERCADHWQRHRGKQRDAETVWLDSGRTCSHDFPRSEEHTSELKSLMRISYAVFCL